MAAFCTTGPAEVARGVSQHPDTGVLAGQQAGNTGREVPCQPLTMAAGAAQLALGPAVVVGLDQPCRGPQIACRALDQARGLVLVVEAQPGRDLVQVLSLRIEVASG